MTVQQTRSQDPGSDPPSAPAQEADRFDEVLATVRRVWGFERLRPLQTEAVRAALDGRDALVVLPTGGGKSLCYQAPALVRDGLTVVVSPLISLMRDQVQGLAQHGVAAGMLASVQSEDDRREVERALWERRMKLLYVAPERLMQGGFLSWLERLGLAAIAIDEAHCISHWGHDFRPEYRQLGELKAQRPELPIQGFTATATEAVRDDVVRQLGLVDPEVLIGGFDRPELTYRVLPRGDLVQQVEGVVRRHAGRAGIVYCLKRTDTERVARELASRGIRSVAYHAGLERGVRERAQNAFENEEVDVVCATVAFGMGIDRSDVRFVVHASLPKGVEPYVQETGRAGRDGLPAECVMFYGGSDFHGWRNLMERPAGTYEGEVDPEELDRGLQRLSDVWGFATGATCRHRFLSAYFGQEERWTSEHPDGGCGACDVCLGEIRTVDDGQIVAQKILSCVVRCGQRFGAQHVTDVLRGSQSRRVKSFGHDELSTFGLLEDHAAREVRAWIDQLIGLDCLRVTPGQYPTLVLAPPGAEVLRNEREVTLFAPTLPPASTRRSKRAGAAEAREALEGTGLEPDDALFESLRQLRRKLARERAVPPYLIFNDRTLVEMAARKPRTEAELLAIKGVGEKKAADLGPAFLAEIAATASA